MAKGVTIYGRQLLALREEKSFSREALARASGVSRENLRRIETRDETTVHPDTLRKLAPPLELSVDVLRVRVCVSVAQVSITVDGRPAVIRSPDSVAVDTIVAVLRKGLGNRLNVAVLAVEEVDLGDNAVTDAADTDPTVPPDVIRSVGGVTLPADTTARPATPPPAGAAGGKPLAKSLKRGGLRRKSAKGGK